MIVEFWNRKDFRHYNEVFVEIAVLCNISLFSASRFSFIFDFCITKMNFKFWKVPQQTNAYMSNKWPLKLPCAYLNTQGSSPSGTPLKRIDDGKVFDIIMRYSLKMPSFVQYFVVLGKSIFLHFRSISNKLKKSCFNMG
ncbi:hypothetical protein T07_13680 [Trichinella nelsoni]|uniref:Uncharacterized protein n=1 Tax=Trichinella nelsoni TaxID=6336 RepID=A0A0V0RP44_9BILA|nr:hypothetical protein T07_13680 [Trichinella nelsoni]